MDRSLIYMLDRAWELANQVYHTLATTMDDSIYKSYSENQLLGTSYIQGECIHFGQALF